MVDWNKLTEATRLGQQAPQDRNIEALAGGYQAGKAGALEETRNEQGIRANNLKQILASHVPYKEDGSPFSIDEMNTMMDNVMKGVPMNGKIMLQPKKGDKDYTGRTFLVDINTGETSDIGASGADKNQYIARDISGSKAKAKSSKEDPIYKRMIEERDTKNKELINVSKGIIAGDEGVIQAEVANLNNLVQDYMKRNYPKEYKPQEFERQSTGLFGWGKGRVVPRNEVERTTEDGRVAIFNAKTKKFIRYK